MSIKKILGTSLILFSTIPIVVFGYLTSYKVYNTSRQKDEDSMIHLSEAYAYKLSSELKEVEADLTTLSENDEIQSLLSNELSSSASTLPSNGNRIKNANNAITDIVKLCPSYRNIDLYTTNFSKLITTNESYCTPNDIIETISNKSPSQNKLNFYFPNTSSQKQSKENTVLMNYPVMDKQSQEVLGYLILNLDLNYFKSIYEVPKGLTSLQLYDYDNNTLYLIEKQKNLNQYRFLVMDITKNTNYKSLITSLIQNDKKDLDSSLYTSFLTQRLHHKNYVIAYSILPEFKWAYVTQKETSVLAIMKEDIFLPFLIVIITTMLFIYLVSKHITKSYTRPIDELNHIIVQAANGNLDVKSDIVSKNEIGQLSQSFNKMIHMIKLNYDELREVHQTLIDKEEELRSNYKQIEYLAYHDMLTQLPNKLTFHKIMNDALKASTKNEHHAVFFVDLDNFKTINDTLGHDYGDRLLAETSARLNSLMTEQDILARAGGDEFLIFRQNVSSSESAMNFAKDILNVFKNPLILHKKSVYVSMSIGIAMYPENGTTSNTLIKNADIAMYKSKDTGRNKVTLFNNRMQDELSRNAEILEVLRHAIENNEVFLMYQPQISIDSKEIIGYEALMRIHSKTLGILSPVEFIPIAEDSGLIIELGAWALYEACRFTKELIDEYGSPITVSVNISSVQLNRAGFFTTLADVLDQTELPPECLELEITESSLLYSLLDAVTLFKNFQTLGVKIALDDFGTGYSSLNYLTNMPINTLKIDKSFIDNIAADQKDTYIAETIIRLAHNLNIHVIAEGVEDDKQLDILKKYKCDRIQGYLFSKPLNSADMKSFVEG